METLQKEEKVKQKGLAPILIIILVAIALGSGGYIVYKQQTKPIPSPQNSVATSQTPQPALNVEVEKERIKDATNIPRQYTIHVEKGKLLILPHRVMVHGGSDVRVTASTKGNNITVVEEEVLGAVGAISSKGDLFKIAEAVDTNGLQPGDYTVVVQYRRWGNKADPDEVNRVITTTMLQEVVRID